MECLQTKGSKVIQAKGDADVQIAKAPVTISSFKYITLLGEDIDLFVLILYHVWKQTALNYISVGAKQSQMSLISRNLETQRILIYCFSMSLSNET